jgi:hypothetical protein
MITIASGAESMSCLNSSPIFCPNRCTSGGGRLLKSIGTRYPQAKHRSRQRILYPDTPPVRLDGKPAKREAKPAPGAADSRVGNVDLYEAIEDGLAQFLGHALARVCNSNFCHFCARRDAAAASRTFSEDFRSRKRTPER